MKISVLGDIMCEPPVIKGGVKKDKTYNFDFVFEDSKKIWENSDYVLGNIEFPLAGAEVGFTDRYFVFNAPDEYADAVKAAGINMVSTINNHTLDRGPDGMYRTLDVLDKIGLPHTGSFKQGEHKEAEYFELDGKRFAVVCYTYSTNAKLPEKDDPRIESLNTLRHLGANQYLPEVVKQLNSWVERRFKKCKGETKAKIRKFFFMTPSLPRRDDLLEPEKVEQNVEKMIADVKKAKENADFVIFYPHIGGQFNPLPGEFSKYVIKKAIEAGADAVLASHSHMTQKIDEVDGIPVAYSLGNFNMDPDSILMVKPHRCEYGLIAHLYIEDGKIDKMSYSIVKSVRVGKTIKTYPVSDIFATLTSKRKKAKLIEDVKWVYNQVSGKELTGEVFKEEYFI